MNDKCKNFAKELLDMGELFSKACLLILKDGPQHQFYFSPKRIRVIDGVYALEGVSSTVNAVLDPDLKNYPEDDNNIFFIGLGKISDYGEDKIEVFNKYRDKNMVITILTRANNDGDVFFRDISKENLEYGTIEHKVAIAACMVADYLRYKDISSIDLLNEKIKEFID